MYPLIVFITAFFLVIIATPSLIKVAILKRLLDEPDEHRKLHSRRVPTIGGIIIFAATIFSFALWFPTESFFKTDGIGNQISDLKYLSEVNLSTSSMNDFKYILATMLIMFFVGVKDDIIGTAAIKKLMAHILVGMVLVLMANVRLTGMHGVFGILELPYWATVFFSIFTIIVVINAFNLIDGVDGLAAGVGLISSAAFGTWFLIAGDNVMSLLAFSLAGALFGFLFFNFSPAKIFMGDSGSLIIGLITVIMAIRLIEYNRLDQSDSVMITEISKPVFAMAVLAYPLMDTLRVFVIRIIKGISPFTADRNHIHHHLMDLGFSHRKTVLIIYSANILIVAGVIAVRNFQVGIQLLIIGGAAILLSQVPVFFNNRRRRKLEEKNKLTAVHVNDKKVAANEV